MAFESPSRTAPTRVVVHYHEIALKRGNRRWFVDQLRQNIRAGLRGAGVRRVRSITGRLVLNLRPQADWERIRTTLARTFGIVYFAPAWRCERTPEAITATALAALGDRTARSFAVRVKRADKQFPIPSMELARQVGGALKEATGWDVDLGNPDVTVTVEVVPEEAFILVGRHGGPGGLPTHTSGRVVALLSGGIDSPVAALRMMRRGCVVEFVHFHGAPFQDRSSIDKVTELAEVLSGYQGSARLHLIPFGETQSRIVAAVPRPYRVVLYRRMMLRIACALAARVGAQAVVTGESLGQVASQTLENLSVIGAAATLPVLRPLVGMDKAEITEQAMELGTFAISTRPDQDCCQLFVPKHPATAAKLADVEAIEAPLEVDAWLHAALAADELVECGRRPSTFREAERQPGVAAEDGSETNDLA